MASNKAASPKPQPKDLAKPSANHKAAPTEAPLVKSKKSKLVRDSFTMPKAEYGAIEELKRRTALLGNQAKKSELLRAGLKLLATLNNNALAAALATVPSIKTGRPSKRDVAKIPNPPPNKPVAISKAAPVRATRNR